uniref:Uncharacterized protein n=1 Tax=Anguilla anguilla TaxID=7936 RepID=A0A0E9X6J0_ANGAN
MQGSIQRRMTFPFCPAVPAESTNVSRPVKPKKKKINIRGKKSERTECHSSQERHRVTWQKSRMQSSHGPNWSEQVVACLNE